MKRVLKIIVVSLVILFVLFYGIPQLVNHKAPYFGFEQGSIGTKDLLVYYGDVLCAVGAFVGIFFTAHFAQRQYRKDEINRVRPYLSLTYLHAKSKVNPLELLNQAEEPREEDWIY